MFIVICIYGVDDIRFAKRSLVSGETIFTGRQRRTWESQALFDLLMFFFLSLFFIFFFRRGEVEGNSLRKVYVECLKNVKERDQIAKK